MNNNSNMAHASTSGDSTTLKKKRVKPFTHCGACHFNINKKNIAEHNASPEHIMNSNIAFADSPAVDVKGMGRNATFEECHNFFSSFGTIKKIILQLPSDPDIMRITFQKYEDANSLRNIKEPLYYKTNQLLIWAAFNSQKDKEKPATSVTVEQGSVTPQNKHGYVTPQNKRGKVTPQNGRGNVTPPNKRGYVTPQNKAGYVTPQNKRGKVIPQNGRGNVTPPNKRGNVTTPRPRHDNVTPQNNQGDGQYQKKKRVKHRFFEITVPEAISLNLQGDFKDQLSALMSHIRLSVADVDRMKAVCNDLETTFRKVFPACQILPFGSIVNGLGFVGSDIDCFCDLRSPLQGPNTDKDTELMIMKRAKNILYGHSFKYSNIVHIASATVPVIKLKHRKTDIDVDVNFKSPLSLGNSELIRYLLNSDERLLPLAIFIKYWAKSINFIGNNKFTSYSITLLVLFYLQRIDKPILPPVAYLQRNPQYDKYIGYWNVGFSKQNMPITQNTQNVLSLIEGFFDFYADFLFEDTVICPHSGLAISIDKFAQLDLPIEYKYYVDCVLQGKARNFISKKSPLMLQDPLELERNCSAGIPPTVLENFKAECLASSHIIKMARFNNNQSDLIVDLTSLCKTVTSVDPTKPLAYYLPIKMPQLPIDQGYFDSWGDEICRNVGQMVEEILTNVAKCRYTVTSTARMDRPNGKPDPPKLTFQGQVFFNMWSTRNAYKKIEEVRSVRRESIVSDDMYNNLYINQNPQTPLMSFTMEIVVRVKPRTYEILLQPHACLTNFLEFINLIMPLIELELRQYVVT